MVPGSRPARSAHSASRAISALASLNALARGIQPSQKSTTRASEYFVSPPSSTGGFGFCTGFGYDQTGSKSTNGPWYCGVSSRHRVLIAFARSHMTLKRFLNPVPWFSISSAFHPAPMPSSKRPPESRSRVAHSFASTMGSRSVSSAMAVPTRRVFVAAAAYASPTRGSTVFLYSSGSSPPPGQGLRRLVGMWVCSGTKSDSKPRSSASRASSSMRMV